MRYGEPIGDRNVAAHLCKSGKLGCFNPRHLRWATVQENHDDMVIHGTVLRGEAAPRAKLSALDVNAIRAGIKSGESQKLIAEKFQVDPSTISLIATGKRWT
jgi:hypothetical protein